MKGAKLKSPKTYKSITIRLVGSDGSDDGEVKNVPTIQRSMNTEMVYTT